MNAYTRASAIAIVGLSLILVTACGGGSGSLGTVPPVAPTPGASAASAAPDVTPGASATPSSSPLTPSAEPSLGTPSPSSSAATTGTMVVRAYFVLGGAPGSAGLVPVLRDVPQTAGVATAAMTALLAGPSVSEAADRTITTAVPAGTTLLGITIKQGVATVDLSTEFDSGGGADSLRYRLAQVVYTLTQFSTVTSVVFQIEGQTVSVFGSAGVVLDGPVGRADFYGQLPSIFVDRPAYGAAIGNPAHVTGNADVFEATFRVALLGVSGASLVDQQVMATCGTGCRGTFDVTLKYSVAKDQWGTLRVYDLSAKDGSREDVRDYPVWLTAGG